MKPTVAVVTPFVAFVLQACTTPYVEPQGSNVGVLTIKNSTDRAVVLQGFKNAADCSGGRLVLTPSNTVPPFGEITVKVQPDEPFSFFSSYSLVSGGKITYCHLPATFTPRSGGRYTVHFSVDSTVSICYMPMTARTLSGEQPEPSFKLRQWQRPFADSGSFCK